MTAPRRCWSFGSRTLLVGVTVLGCLAVPCMASDDAKEDALRAKAGERAIDYVTKLTQGKIKLGPPFCTRSDKPGTWNVVVDEDSLVVDSPVWVLEVTDAGEVADWWERNKPKVPAPTTRPAKAKRPVYRCWRIR